LPHPVVAIGLDAASLPLLERWTREGELPVLARFFAQAAHARLTMLDTHLTELPWTLFLTGVAPQRTGYWTPIAFDPDRYAVREIGAYDFAEHPPFYARSQGLRSIVFDVPQSALVAGLPALQIRGWGAHSAMTPSGSLPEGLLAELTQRHGAHPTFGDDHGEPWDLMRLAKLRDGLIEGVRRKAAIGCELLARRPFDLFVTVFCECHVAGHMMWHQSQPDSPIAQPRLGADPLLEVYRATDAAIGALLAAAPPAARFAIFSPHGMQANAMDLPSMLFLPELLYRMSGRGRFGLARGDTAAPVRRPAQTMPFIDEVWARKHDWNPLRRRARRRGVRASQRSERWLGSGGGPAHPSHLPELAFLPAAWYRNLWPSLPAFALPSVGQGHVRVNLRGRERHGRVDPADYDALLARVSEQVARMANPRSGKPLARRVWRSRASPLERDPKLPDADLVVVWDDEPADACDCGELGRIGPVPYHRSGGHHGEGFLAVTGPDIAPGSRGAHATIDLAPTLLRLAGAQIPPGLDGSAVAFEG
jgi:predicted AlkP superfamily phosphohydrolase/phosphomutase